MWYGKQSTVFAFLKVIFNSMLWWTLVECGLDLILNSFIYSFSCFYFPKTFQLKVIAMLMFENVSFFNICTGLTSFVLHSYN